MSGTLPRVVHLVTGQLQDVPADDGWLSAGERAVLATLKLQKRRADWRLGRWLAKQAVAIATGTAADRIEVMAGEDGAPEAVGAEAAVALSLSHRHGRGLAAVAVGASPIGCDLELVEPRSDRFIRDWLTTAESTRVFAAAEAARPLLANLCWSAKESATKVLRVGLRFDTRSFDVALPADDPDETTALEWRPIAVTALKAGEAFQGMWRLRDGWVETVLGRGPFEIREEGSGKR